MTTKEKIDELLERKKALQKRYENDMNDIQHEISVLYAICPASYDKKHVMKNGGDHYSEHLFCKNCGFGR